MPGDDVPRQLALDLPHEERRASEDFFVSPSNEAAYATVESWPRWPDPLLVLVGPDGAGKSHLAAIWADRAHAWRCAPSAISLGDVPHLVSSGALVIEDLDRAAFDEAALFHLVNAMRERRGFILMTARSGPSTWPVSTPDLISRLRRATTTSIAAPDDALLRAVLVKLFLDRQLAVDTSVIETIILRAERSFAAARAVVATLDRMALAAGRRITGAMAQEAIARMEASDEAEP